MPKHTFFNLPEEKKQSLINAAKKEFSRASLNEASISNIIKTTGIPRGSFYQYFHDKEDVFFFLLNEQAKERQKMFILKLKETDGDIFETITDLFQSMLKNSLNQDNCDFFRNAFLNMNYKIENIFTKEFCEDRYNKQFMDISHLVNTTNLNISDENELFHTIKIIIAVAFHNLVQSYARELSYDEATNLFTIEMDLLKKGLYKDRLE